MGDSCSTKNLGKGVLLVKVLSGCRSEGQGFLVPGWRELDLEDAAWIWPDWNATSIDVWWSCMLELVARSAASLHGSMCWHQACFSCSYSEKAGSALIFMLIRLGLCLSQQCLPPWNSNRTIVPVSGDTRSYFVILGRFRNQTESGSIPQHEQRLSTFTGASYSCSDSNKLF